MRSARVAKAVRHRSFPAQSVVGFLTQHPIHRGPTDLKRLGYVDRPHALCLQFAHSRRLYRRRPAKRITRLARIEQAPTGEWVTSRHNRLILTTISISLKSST